MLRMWYANMDVESGDTVKIVRPEIVNPLIKDAVYDIEFLAIVPGNAKYLSRYVIDLVPKAPISKKKPCPQMHTYSDCASLIIIQKAGDNHKDEYTDMTEMVNKQ